MLLRGGGRIGRDHVSVEIPDLAVLGLNLREEFAANQDRETFAAGDEGDGAGGHSGFVEDLRIPRIFGAVDVAEIVSPRG